eukprot:821216_1
MPGEPTNFPDYDGRFDSLNDSELLKQFINAVDDITSGKIINWFRRIGCSVAQIFTKQNPVPNFSQQNEFRRALQQLCAHMERHVDFLPNWLMDLSSALKLNKHVFSPQDKIVEKLCDRMDSLAVLAPTHSTVSFANDVSASVSLKPISVVSKLSPAYSVVIDDIKSLVAEFSKEYRVKDKYLVKTCDHSEHKRYTKKLEARITLRSSSGFIQTPVRSTACRHVDCFDAETFLRSVVGTPCSSWQCPICKIYITFETLFVDGFVQHILRQEVVIREKLPCIWVSLDGGRWRKEPKYGKSGIISSSSKDTPMEVTQNNNVSNHDSGYFSSSRGYNPRSELLHSSHSKSRTNSTRSITVVKPSSCCPSSGSVHASGSSCSRKPTSQAPPTRNIVPTVISDKSTSAYTMSGIQSSSVTVLSVPPNASPGLRVKAHDFCSKFGWTFSDTVSRSRVLVVDTMDPCGTVTCERTHEYLLCMLGSTQIVSQKWLAECFSQDNCVDLKPFRVQADTSCLKARPLQHRTPKTQRNGKLFDDCQFYIDHSLKHDTKLPELISFGGGSIFEEKPALADRGSARYSLYISGYDSLDSPERPKIYDLHMTPVTQDWIRDSISHYKIQPFGRYDLKVFRKSLPKPQSIVIPTQPPHLLSRPQIERSGTRISRRSLSVSPISRRTKPSTESLSTSRGKVSKSTVSSSSNNLEALPLSSSQRDPPSQPRCQISMNRQEKRIIKPHSLRAQVLARNHQGKVQTGKTKSTNQLSISFTLRRNTECSTSQSQGKVPKSKASSSSNTHQSLTLSSLKRSSSQHDPLSQSRCQVTINRQEQRITKPYSLRAQVPARKAKSTQQLPTSSNMRPNTETAMNSSALDNCRSETSTISPSRKQTIGRTPGLSESIKSTSVQTGLATDKSTESDCHKSNAKPSSPTKKRNKSSTVSSSVSIQMSTTINQCQLSHSSGGSLINSDPSTKPVSVPSIINILESPRVSAKPKPARQCVSNRSRQQISRRKLQVSCHDLVQVDPIPMTLESNSNIDNATNDLSHKSSKVSSRPEISPNTSTARSRKRKAPVQMSESSKRSRVGTLEKRRRLKGRKRKATPVKAPGKRKRLKKLSEHRSKRHVSDMVDLVSSSSEDEDTTCSSDADASTLVSTWRSSNNMQRSRRRLESNFMEPENSDTLTETDSSDGDGAGEVYEVESIRSEWIWIDHGEGGSENPIDTGSFLEVKWVGYDDSENTLQDRQSLKSSPDVLRFWDENQKQGSISV